MDGRMFIQFLALVLISSIRSVAKDSEALKYKGAREVLEAMESVVRITFSGRHSSITTETCPLQLKIIETFGLQLDS
jgi:hypothetical protein